MNDGPGSSADETPGWTPPPAPAATSSADAGGNWGAMGTSAASSLLGAYSQYQAGAYNRKIADFNANYQRQQAGEAFQAGEAQVGARTLGERQAIGRTNAGAAGGGVVAGAGSAGAAVASQQALAAGDIQSIRINALRAAFGYDVGAVDAQNKAKMAQTTANEGVASSLLGGAYQEELLGDPRFEGRIPLNMAGR